MNSASRLLKLVTIYSNYSKEKQQKINEKIYGKFYEDKLKINKNNQISFLNTQITIIKEINRLRNHLEKINKYDKYKQVIIDLEKLFVNKLPNSPLASFQDITLKNIEMRLEIIEDLLEAKNIIENEIIENEMEEIFKIFNLLISRLEKKEDKNDNIIKYIIFLKTINESLNYYKINGANTLEKSLEKLICRNKFIDSTISKEVKDDMNSIIGSIYNIYEKTIKYPNKIITYAKEQHKKQL